MEFLTLRTFRRVAIEINPLHLAEAGLHHPRGHTPSWFHVDIAKPM
jgi:hypothetical protein